METKSLLMIGALIITGLFVYNTQIKNRQMPELNSSKFRDKLDVTGDNIKNPTDLVRNGVEIPLHIMCKKSGGTLFGGKCYEGKAKEMTAREDNETAQ